MTVLTEEYLMEHAHRIHTYDSFGRALAVNVMKAAAEFVRVHGEQEEVMLEEVAVRVKAYPAAECVEFCFDFGDPVGTICIHADVNI